MKTKEYHFDVEMIIDHSIEFIMGKDVQISTHRTFRGLKLTELVDLIRNNNVPTDEKEQITFNIRGVNF